MATQQLDDQQRSGRASQLQDLIQTQAGHGDIISYTHTFALSRKVQGEVLMTARLGKELSSVLFLGPGDGSEAAKVFQFAGIDPNSVSLSAIEFSEPRAKSFKDKFGNAQVTVHDFSKGDFGLQDGMTKFEVVQCGFVLNDQTELGKRAICASAFAALKPGGLFLVAEILLEKHPNIPSRWNSADAEESVNRELQEYYQPYLDQLSEIPGFSADQRSAFEQSIHKAWSDAKAHKEGREAFDTKETFTEILEQAGFRNIQFSHAYNKGWVISAVKPDTT